MCVNYVIFYYFYKHILIFCILKIMMLMLFVKKQKKKGVPFGLGQSGPARTRHGHDWPCPGPSRPKSIRTVPRHGTNCSGPCRASSIYIFSRCEYNIFLNEPSNTRDGNIFLNGPIPSLPSQISKTSLKIFFNFGFRPTEHMIELL
jgi:hypothetical protein